MAAVYLKANREKSVLRKHPWVFSGAVEKVAGNPQSGETVGIYSSDNNFLAWAAYSPHSQIRARIWTWDEHQKVDAVFFYKRLVSAVNLRKFHFQNNETNAFRLVHAESDGLPGLIIDQYNDTLVFQCLSAGIDLWRDTLVDVMCEVTGCRNVYERSDVDVRQLEGLSERTGGVFEDIPDLVQIIENGLSFWVDVKHGQKTGFYLDQRRSRQRVSQLVKDRSVLNCFSYSGGFSVFALAGGANSVLSVDSSNEALQLAVKNLELNHFTAAKSEILEGDVFQILRRFRDCNRKFDAIIMDPPKFAHTAAQAEKAARGYKDINLLAFKLLNPGGLLFTFSCSGGISADLFQKIIAGAALDAGVRACLVEHLSQDVDHPVALNFPEGAYLKGLICQLEN